MNILVVWELVCYGICVNLIVLGLFGMFMVKLLGEKVVNLFVEMCEVFKCMGEMEEFVYICFFLFENGYMNGCIVWLDGVIVM